MPLDDLLTEADIDRACVADIGLIGFPADAGRRRPTPPPRSSPR